MITLYDVIRIPAMTEKAIQLKEKRNSIVFKVHPKADKTQIKAAVESFFSVKVEAVRTMNYRGKVKRFGKNVGRRKDWKKAVVVLAEGESIPDFV
ncbi:MAG: 50S ribosomal protein L23 [Deferribacteraceae bacterium]|jgi:large subunit ribosomal protein L23|nr:50S ribosomal protein L23 [Deferribacteraceae bacterium]